MKDIICHVTHIVYLEEHDHGAVFKCLTCFLFNLFFEGELRLLVRFQFSEDTVKFYIG